MHSDYRSTLREAALETWGRIAEYGHWDVNDYSPELLSARRDGNLGGRVVMRLRGDPDMILKMRIGGSPEQFARMVQAYEMAAHALGSVPGCHAPVVLDANMQHQTVLLSHCDGVTARDYLCEHGDDPHVRPAVIGAAGRWLSAFHARQERGSGVFEPESSLARLKSIADNRKLADPEKFDALFAALRLIAEQAQGQTCERSIVHGDMALSNLMLDGDDVWGINFDNVGPSPKVRDISMLLTDYTVWFGQQDDVPAFDLLAPQIATAFWDSYGTDLRDSQVLKFYCGMQLLLTWVYMPANPASRTAQRANIWTGLRQAAPRFLLGEV